MFQRQTNGHDVKLFYKCLCCGTLYSPTFQTGSKRCKNCGNIDFLLLKFRIPKRFTFSQKSKGCYSISDAERIETVKESNRGVFELNFEALAKGAPLIISTRPGVYEVKLEYELEKLKTANHA